MATKRAIYVAGAEKWVSIGCYVRNIKKAKANPDATFRCTLESWAPGTGRQIMQEFRRGLMDRINQAVPYMQRGVTA